MQELIECLIVPETWFFRDRAAFDLLVQIVRKAKSVRLFSVACATGEEPYSMAMALLAALIPPEKIRIDAIDISKNALLKAEKGLYGSHSFRGRGGEERERFFDKVKEGYQIKKEVRKLVHFSYDNICRLHDADGKTLYDVIFFRNLLIYLHPAAQKQALQNCGKLLLPDGVLIVTPAEAAIVARHGYQLKQMGRAFVLKKHEAKKETKHVAAKIALFPKPECAVKNVTAEGLEGAREMADSGRFKEAEALCRAYLANESMNAEAHFLLGAIRHAQGDEKEAEECFKKTVYLKPQHDEALVYLVLLAEKRGDKAQADQYRRRIKK